MVQRNEQAVAVVTGGAGGLGSAICRKLAGEGMWVVVGYHRSAEAAQRLASSLPGRGHSARPAPVTESAQLAALASGIAKDYGRCDVLVNCAGNTRFVPHGRRTCAGRSRPCARSGRCWKKARCEAEAWW